MSPLGPNGAAVARALQWPAQRCAVELEGRVVRARCAPGRYGSRGASTLTVTTSLATRFSVARRSAAGEAIDSAFPVGLKPLGVTLIGVEGGAVLSAEADWGHRAAKDPAALGAIRALFDAVGDGRAILSLRPGALVFSITEPDHDAIDAAMAQRLVASMLGFVRAVEALPPPAARLPRTRIEKMADDPETTQRWVFVGLVVMVASLMLLSLLMVAALVALR